MKRFLLALAASLATLLTAISCAQAQFADQRQYAPASSGSANAQTVAIPNYALNLGVAVRFRPSYSNTGALTLNVNGSGVVPVQKQTASGLLPLSGGEVVSGQIAEVFFDGAQYELLNNPSAGYVWAGTSSGAANAQTVVAPAPSAGQQIAFLAGFTNTGALTLNGVAVDKDLINGPAPLTGREVYAGNVVSVWYDSGLSVYHLVAIGNFVQGAVTLASASTVDLGATGSSNIVITGTTAITSFGSSASGTYPLYRVTFLGALTLTENPSSMLLPGGANIITGSGDSLVALYLGSGNWRVLSYSSAYIPPYPRTPAPTIYGSGSGTYTTPAGAAYLKVRMCGGGGGGGGSGLTNSGGAGGAGGASIFGGLTANGGNATPTSGTSSYPSVATASGGDYNFNGSLGQAPISAAVTSGGLYQATVGGGMGGAAPFGGSGGSGGGIYINGTTQTLIAPNSGDYCSGGGGGGSTQGNNVNEGWGGNSGAYLEKYISSPSATYSYAVGSGGSAGGAGTGGNAGAAGSGGFITIEAYYQ